MTATPFRDEGITNLFPTNDIAIALSPASVLKTNIRVRPKVIYSINISDLNSRWLSDNLGKTT